MADDKYNPLKIEDISLIKINHISNYAIYFSYGEKKYFIKECNGLPDDAEDGYSNIFLLFSKENEVIHFVAKANRFDSCVSSLFGNIKKVFLTQNILDLDILKNL